MRLVDLAHSRAGDKGVLTTLSVIARDPSDYARLARLVTPARVRAHLGELIEDTVLRYELPQLGALNFVVRRPGRDDVTRTLALDAHGKSLSFALLSMELPTDDEDQT